MASFPRNPEAGAMLWYLRKTVLREVQQQKRNLKIETGSKLQGSMEVRTEGGNRNQRNKLFKEIYHHKQIKRWVTDKKSDGLGVYVWFLAKPFIKLLV